jgi:hypothetical protein
MKKKIKNPVNPSTANPATPSPITVPPPKETFNACGKLALLLCYILFLAIFIPYFSAKTERAPKQNHYE